MNNVIYKVNSVHRITLSGFLCKSLRSLICSFALSVTVSVTVSVILYFEYCFVFFGCLCVMSRKSSRVVLCFTLHECMTPSAHYYCISISITSISLVVSS